MNKVITKQCALDFAVRSSHHDEATQNIVDRAAAFEKFLTVESTRPTKRKRAK